MSSCINLDTHRPRPSDEPLFVNNGVCEYDPRCETFEKMHSAQASYDRRASWRTQSSGFEDWGFALAQRESDLSNAAALDHHGKFAIKSSTDSVEERRSLDWDSSFDPFVSSTFRRGSLTHDPAAFNSTMSLGVACPEKSARVRLRRSAELFLDFGKRVFKKRSKSQTDVSEDNKAGFSQGHSPSVSNSSNTYSQSASTAARSRSNTLDSSPSSRSLRSKPSYQNFSDVTPFSPYQSTFSPNSASPDIHARIDPALLSSHSRTTSHLSPLPEQSKNPMLADIMKQMQADDHAFKEAEQKLRESSWSTDSELSQLRAKRLEQHNLWQRQIDDALDAIRAYSD